MHLPNGREHTVRFGALPDEHVAKKVQSSSALDSQHHDGAEKTNGSVSKPNEARILLPNGSDRDSVLDTVLAAWAILIHRYQRDVFHQFTWGIKDQGNDSTQCISITEIDWASQQTAASLQAKISSVKSSQFKLGEDTTIFLNDGINEEVILKLSI